MKVMTMIAALVGAGVMLTAQQPLFRTGVEVVELDVSVTRGGKPVLGRTASDFVLTDNGERQEIDSVSLEQLPLDVTLVVDASQSVAGERLASLIGAATRLTAALHREDQLAVDRFHIGYTSRRR
jgi:glycerophosphoryl diester phosphodiesterase